MAGYTNKPVDLGPEQTERNKKLQQKGVTYVPRALMDMFASALRGGVTSAVGTPGDLAKLAAGGGDSPATSVLPTSEEVSQKLPPVERGVAPSPYEKIGEYLPTNAGSAASKAALAAAAAGNVKLLRKGMPLIHSSSFRSGIPKELQHPSLMIPSPKAGGEDHPAFSFGSNLLVGRYPSFEPRTSPTVIKGSDFFTPRSDMRQHNFSLINPDVEMSPEVGAVLDMIMERHALTSNYKSRKTLEDEFVNILRKNNLQPTEKQIADARLRDKFQTLYPRGAPFAEGNIGQQIDEPWRIASAASPRFQSFEHFANSPKGMGRLMLDREMGYHPSMDTAKFDDFLDFLGGRNEVKLPIKSELGSSEVPVNSPSVKVLPDYFNQLFDKETWKGATVAGHLLEAEKAKGYLDMLRRKRRIHLDEAPSEYAEIKRYGPTQVTGDNFTHAILEPDIYQKQGDWLRNRGIIPVDSLELHTGGTAFGPVKKDFAQNFGVDTKDLMRAISEVQLLRRDTR